MTDGTTRFAFSALRVDGTQSDGEITAPTATDAYERLTANQLLPLRIASVPQSTDRRRLPASELALGLRILADVLDSGIPMQRALSLFGELAPTAWQAALPEIREAIREGRSLSGALADCGLDLPDLILGMIRAGESGHGLATAIRRASEQAESSARVRAAMRSALAYPAFVATAGALTLAVMVGVVIPRFAIILSDLGQQLPMSTRLVLDIAAMARVAALPVLVLCALAGAHVARTRRTADGAVAIDALLLRLPLIGEVRRAAATSRVAATLGALLDSGIAFQPALRLAAAAGGDASIARELQRSGEDIRSGESIASALRRYPALTPAALRLIDAGERTGRLVPLLDHAARMEQDRATRTIEAGVRFLEPTLILLFALVVGIVAIALLQAVYAVRPA